MKESTRKIDDFFARFFKIVGKLLKFTFYALIIFVNAFLLLRIFSMNADPKAMETLMVNDRTAAAYAEAGDSLVVITQEQTTLNEEGLFAQSNLRYLPDIDQLQITARYNRSTLKYMAEEYELTEVPAREEDVFDVTLVKVIALTEEEQKQAEEAALNADAIGEDAAEISLPRKKVRYFPAASVSDAKTVYQYYRYIFEDVDLSDASEVYLEFYYKDFINYEADPYSDVLIWRKGADLPYELTRRDLGALKGGAVDYD